MNGHQRRLVAWTNSIYSDGGPRSRGDASCRSQSQQPNESINVVVVTNIFVRHPHLQLHSNALQQAAQDEVLQYCCTKLRCLHQISRKYWRAMKQLSSRAARSASPVLTATGFVNGKWRSSTPYRIDTHQSITKSLSQVITSAIPTDLPI